MKNGRNRPTISYATTAHSTRPTVQSEHSAPLALRFGPPSTTEPTSSITLRVGDDLARDLAEVLLRHSRSVSGFYITPPRRKRGFWKSLWRAVLG